MNDDRLERLLQGYGPPEVSKRLDRRVLDDADRILAAARLKSASLDAAQAGLNAFGFGYLGWLYDFVNASGAEYRVEIL